MYMHDLQAELPTPTLVCIDLQQNLLAQLEQSASGSAQAIALYQAILRHARRRAWPVVHVFRKPTTAFRTGLGTYAPIRTLEPLPEEMVLFRTGESAFSNPRFCEITEQPDANFILLGAELGAACLATVIDAHDRGVSMGLVDDALVGTPNLPNLGSQTVRSVLLGLTGSFATRLSSAELLRLPQATFATAAAANCS